MTKEAALVATVTAGGLVFAFIAVSLTWATGNPMWDAHGGIGIGVLLIVVAVLVGVEVKQLLVGQGVETSQRAEMKAFLEGQPAIDKVFQMLTLHMGADVMVAVKARLKPQGGEDAMVAAINQVEAAFSAKFPEVQWIFFEPDVAD